jgi:hypothetical protein
MEYKIKKQKKLNNELNLCVTEDPYNLRIFVEFYSDDRKLILQRSFQNTFFGVQDSETFAKSLKNLSELKIRLGYSA